MNSNKLIIIFVCVFWLKESVLVVIWLSKVAYKVKMQIYIDWHVYGKYVYEIGTWTRGSNWLGYQPKTDD